MKKRVQKSLDQEGVIEKKQKRKYIIIRNIIFFLDAFLAALIMLTASTLIETTFGKSALTFGMVMLGITTILRVFQQW